MPDRDAAGQTHAVLWTDFTGQTASLADRSPLPSTYVATGSAPAVAGLDRALRARGLTTNVQTLNGL